MVCGRGQGTYPPEFRIRNSKSGIPEQINLALALVHSDVCSAEFQKFRGISGIPENEDRQEPERRSECTTKVLIPYFLSILEDCNNIHNIVRSNNINEARNFSQLQGLADELIGVHLLYIACKEIKQTMIVCFICSSNV